MELEGRTRVVIKGIKPEIEAGRFPIKRVVGETVTVEGTILADGHDALKAVLLYRREIDPLWTEVAMRPLGNDRWSGSFTVIGLGRYLYTVAAWVDRFSSWRRDLAKRVEAGQKDIGVNFLVGAQLVAEASARASTTEKEVMQRWVKDLQSPRVTEEGKTQAAMGKEVAGLMDKYGGRPFPATFNRQLAVVVEREKARFSSWYEMFPRSCTPEAGRHGTFRDCEAQLPYIAEMGFDVLYLPPIHPIGSTNRKGKNNALIAGPDDPGTPWAIGSEEGGHRAIHPRLGALEDFRRLMATAAEHDIEIAMDLAFQCSPDHPYVKEHPSWFSWRPDGTVQYAENPPKKYQDIYPLNFESDDWQELWQELKNVVLFWIGEGVRIFRVDNPHTKPFQFWEWLIAEIKKSSPDTIFLAEAFTRPHVMYHLAELGFSQSYTYFAWRNTKWEITQYFADLARTELNDYLRPHLWPNTPDILTEYLQSGGRASFMSRLVLAATLGASYGIYGPAYELCENRAKEPGSEEYLDSEKYEVRHWDTAWPNSLKDLLGRINRIRRENAALQRDSNLIFHPVDNDRLLCYSKHTDDLSSIILVVANLDPHYTHSGWLELPLDILGIDALQPYQAHDLLSGARYLWHGPRNYVELDPRIVPAHIFRLRRRVRTERDFDYYL